MSVLLLFSFLWVMIDLLVWLVDSSVFCLYFFLQKRSVLKMACIFPLHCCSLPLEQRYTYMYNSVFLSIKEPLVVRSNVVMCCDMM